MAQDAWQDLGPIEEFQESALTEIHLGKTPVAISYRDGESLTALTSYPWRARLYANVSCRVTSSSTTRIFSAISRNHSFGQLTEPPVGFNR